MTRSSTTSGALIAVLTTAAAILIGITPVAAAQPAETLPPGTTRTSQTEFDKPGPYPVATPVHTNPCKDSVWGMIQSVTVRIFGNRDEPTCTQAFPNGLGSPIGVNTYYPANIADLPNAPLLVFGGGILSNPGMYDALAKRWASYGFVVVIPYDFINSLLELPVMGLASAVDANRSPNSPLHDKIDLSRTIFAGHSAGGQSALQAGMTIPALAPSIDPTMKIIGVLAIAPGPLAIGAAITVPTMFLTGSDDFVVPDFAWVRWWQYNTMINAPSWIANARGVTHFSPVDGIDNFPSAGTATAWLRYQAFGDDTAKKYFIGPHWQLPTDNTYLSVERNTLADALT